MRKEMLKPVSKIFALCIALSMFVGNGAIASAANCGVCSYYADKCHRYREVGTGEGYNDYGTHDHLMGYDSKGQEVFRACQWNAYYQYYVEKCSCGSVLSGSRKAKMDYMNHSVASR